MIEAFLRGSLEFVWPLLVLGLAGWVAIGSFYLITALLGRYRGEKAKRKPKGDHIAHYQESN